MRYVLVHHPADGMRPVQLVAVLARALGDLERTGAGLSYVPEIKADTSCPRGKVGLIQLQPRPRVSLAWAQGTIARIGDL